MTQLTSNQAFDLALKHHRAGRWREAEDIYRQILAQQPNHSNAMHYLGVVAQQTGRSDVAVDLITRAIALGVNSAEAHNNLGNALLASGQVERAIAACRKAIELKPNYPEAHTSLGNALANYGKPDEAIAAYRQALAIRPNYAPAFSNLGNVHASRGQTDQAIAAYRQALAISPNLPDAYSNLGVSLRDKGQLDDAIDAYRRAIALRPGYAEAHNNLGVALTDKGEFDQAVEACRQAIVLSPNYAEAHSNLGNALRRKGLLDDAIANYRRAIALKPGYAEAHNNLAAALMESGELDQAIANYRQAIASCPNYVRAHMDLGYALLARGEYKEGFIETEWRTRSTDSAVGQAVAASQWDGSTFQDGTLLLHPEPGLGDTIQFMRYLPLAARRGGRTIVQCTTELQRLLESTARECQIVVEGEPVPHFDFQCPLPSLPRAFGTTLATIPAEVPYLSPGPQLVESWRQKLTASGPGPRIALNWAGNPTFRRDSTRSMSLDRLAPLAQVLGCTFFSLQKGDAARQADHPPAGLRLVNLSADLADFADTAAVMTLMDLVITTDTSVAHLAGALGRPVWVMLQFVPDWRWLLDREDSPWYPSMRLFRQPRRGDWDSVIKRIVQELSRRLEAS